MRSRTSRALQAGSAGTGDNLSRGEVVEFGQASIEPAESGVMVTEDLHGICLKLRQLPIKFDVPKPLTHTIYINHTPFHYLVAFGCITVFGIWMSDGNQLPPAGETACPTYFAKRLINKVGQAVSPAVPMATTNGRHLIDKQIPENG